MASPALGQYVLRLTIDPRERHDDWLYKIHQALPPLLPKLTHLAFRGFPVVQPLFFVLSKRFAFVTHLELQYMKAWSPRDTTRFLRGFTQLEELIIHCCNWDTKDMRPLYAGGTTIDPITIEMEVISTSTDSFGNGHAVLFDWFSRSQPGYSLKYLLLHFSDLPNTTTSDHLDDFVSQISETVEYVQLWHDWNIMTHPRHDSEMMWIPPIAQCRKLKRFDMVPPGVVESLALRYLKSLFLNLPTSLCIITLRFRIRPSSIFTPNYRAFWKAVDTAITSSKFPYLKTVELAWKEPVWEKNWVGRWGDICASDADDALFNLVDRTGVFEDFIPKIVDRGILRFGPIHDPGKTYPASMLFPLSAKRTQTAWSDELHSMKVY
ncbi:hypothetical protein NLI96_g2196 [Meripilus lineatus]|uniref:Uncharacterized protein n=1 Tax=Meripilus lineatus TaxID=2056292 RepID=A0AAD5VBG2_9APHY|nr:hypothetical protein NLI96_g2196 [Physisporinus lineatus]